MKDVSDDDVLQDANKAVINARRAIYEAQLAIERAERQFQLSDIDPEELIGQFERYAGSAARQEFDSFVSAATADFALALELAASQSGLPELGNSPARRLRFHV